MITKQTKDRFFEHTIYICVAYIKNTWLVTKTLLTKYFVVNDKDFSKFFIKITNDHSFNCITPKSLLKQDHKHEFAFNNIFIQILPNNCQVCGRRGGLRVLNYNFSYDF